MVADAPPLLSDNPPEVPRRAGLGDRFHYFRGVSGRRHLFSIVKRDEIADFHSAIVVVARRHADGRLSAYSAIVLDPFGRAAAGDRHRLKTLPADAVVLVHLLAASDVVRRELVADLFPAPEAALAA